MLIPIPSRRSGKRFAPLAFLSLLLTGCVISATPPEYLIPPTADPVSGISGTYAVTGTDPEGGKYTGQLSIEPQGNFYRLMWETRQAPGEKATQNIGVGIVQGSNLAVGWGGLNCMALIYRRQIDNVLDGRWTSTGSDTLQSEHAIPLGPGSLDLPGTYDITGKNSEGTPYTGTLTVAPQGRVYRFNWDIETQYEGIGLQQNEVVAVGWSTDPETACGVALYRIESGGRLNGIWGTPDSEEIGSETAQRK